MSAKPHDLLEYLEKGDRTNERLEGSVALPYEPTPVTHPPFANEVYQQHIEAQTYNPDADEIYRRLMGAQQLQNYQAFGALQAGGLINAPSLSPFLNQVH
jgi:hypothetical protein